ncbi:hypothetical protein [Streptomyces sp. H27-H5]|uniref:hypothetical protein n=1 Tax=Streptomyces sp. H27-H5 TaxID=2996460 RepID=UPI002270F27E|nr:hypothetical protein [Streptomyces sp. H27-H5]MCY0959941.1 hypothetical protein [Streptomyces sp. H27-H5]
MLPARTNTPDVITHDDEGRASTRIKLKRACNGCAQLLGDADNRDVDDRGNLTDVRAECPNCAPLVTLEQAGCRTWQLTVRNIGGVDRALDSYGIFAKGYWQPDVDGKNRVVGLRIGDGLDRQVAYFEDWIIRHPDGRIDIHRKPAAAPSA